MECTMRLTALAGVGVALAMASTGMARGAEPGVLEVGMTVTVAADGSVAAVVPDASLPEPIRTGLVRRVSTWRYEIPQWQGHPVSMETRLALRLEPVATTQGGYALRVLGTGRDPSPNVVMSAPVYPTDLMRRGIGGDFVYALRVDAQGQVADARLLSPNGTLRRGLEQLDAASRQAFHQWILPPIVVDGSALDCYRLIPITFRVGGSPPSKKNAGDRPQWTDYTIPTEGLSRCPATHLLTAIDKTIL